MRTIKTAAAAVCLCLIASGCGKKVGNVKGKLTFADGSNVPVARITFVNDKGKTASVLVEDGVFSMPNAPVGEEVKVTVSTKQIVDEISKVESMLDNQQQQIKDRAGRPTGDRDQVPKDSQDRTAPHLEKLKSHVEETAGKMEKYKKWKEILVPVNAKYETVEKTPLTIKVTSGSQDLSLKLDR